MKKLRAGVAKIDITPELKNVNKKRLSSIQQRLWLRYLLPMPKNIEFKEVTQVSASSLVLHLPESKMIIADQIAEEFGELFRRVGISLKVRWSLPYENTAVLAMDDVLIDESWSYEHSQLRKYALEKVATKDQAYGIVTKADKHWQGIGLYAFRHDSYFYSCYRNGNIGSKCG